MRAKTETVLHYPRLDTVLMVEEGIQKAKEYPSRVELWKSLPRQVHYQTFKLILAYLEKSNKIVFTKNNKIAWVGTNPKLERALRSGKEY